MVHPLVLGCREDSLTFGKPNYLEPVRNEHLACREKVALFDMSPFVKIEIEVSLLWWFSVLITFNFFISLKGNDVLNQLQNLCSNNINVPVAQVVYTGMLNLQGGYQTDCTITRLEDKK